jgi:hypothetical protein
MQKETRRLDALQLLPSKRQGLNQNEIRTWANFQSMMTTDKNAMQVKPIVGQTYVSRTTPELIVYVVNVIDADLEDNIPFVVEGCDPAYKDDTENADGYEITAEVWDRHDFALVTE